MLSRIFWVGLAGIALVTGMILQDGGGVFSWADDRTHVRAERSIDARIDEAIDRGFDRMQVVDGDGKEVDVPGETKRAMAAAVSELVRAETSLALLKVGDESEEDLRAAQARRDTARAEVDRLKAEIEGIEQAARVEQTAVADQVQRQVQEDIRAQVREEVRDAVRN